MGVSKNNGTPKSSILIGFSIMNHPFWDTPIYFWKHPNSALFGFVSYFMTPIRGKRILMSPRLKQGNMTNQGPSCQLILEQPVMNSNHYSYQNQHHHDHQEYQFSSLESHEVHAFHSSVWSLGCDSPEH